MQEIGKIIEIIGDIAKIEITPSGGCAHCAQFNLCHPWGQNKKVIELKNTINGQIGDTVKIEIKENARLLSIGLVFGLPTILFITGLVIGNFLKNEKLGAVFGGCGLVLAVILLKIIDNLLKKKDPNIVVIKEIVRNHLDNTGMC
ncbi:MAG: SoxR reducing system RseC family protein [candidate division WOR-3 bacterium]